jgi:hypothetical protein
MAGRGIPPRIQFEITHYCNKTCPLCDHRIQYSDYPGMTRAQYRYVVSCLDPARFVSVNILGGEPLVHPGFVWFAERVLADFRHARVHILTNGRLMPRYRSRHPKLFGQLRWVVQEYPGFNDNVLAELAGLQNVHVRGYRPFWDPYRDPDLDEALARKIRAQCIHQVRIIGDRLYNCCLAESIERYYHTESVHVTMSPNWREDWIRLETWKACQHCFRAADWFDENGNRI